LYYTLLLLLLLASGAIIDAKLFRFLVNGPAIPGLLRPALSHLGIVGARLLVGRMRFL